MASSGSVSSRMGAFMVATGGAPEGLRSGEVWGAIPSSKYPKKFCVADADGFEKGFPPFMIYVPL